MALLRDINRKLGLTIVLITHEMDVVRSIADRVAVIDAGRIVEEGDVWAVFANPQMPITRSLLAGSRPQLPEHLRSVLDPANGSDLVLSVIWQETMSRDASSPTFRTPSHKDCA